MAIVTSGARYLAEVEECPGWRPTTWMRIGPADGFADLASAGHFADRASSHQFYGRAIRVRDTDGNTYSRATYSWVDDRRIR